MKKINRILSILTIAAALFTVTSCDSLLNGLKEAAESGSGSSSSSSSSDSEEKKEDTSEKSTETINYSFKMTDDKISYVYYTSVNKFSYTQADGTVQNPCCYQVSFNVGKKTWNMYTRPVASITKIDDVANGTFVAADTSEAGEIKLYVDGKLSQTLTAAKADDGYLYFNADVTAVNKAIGAVDAK